MEGSRGGGKQEWRGAGVEGSRGGGQQGWRAAGQATRGSASPSPALPFTHTQAWLLFSPSQPTQDALLEYGNTWGKIHGGKGTHGCFYILNVTE